jgi:outer membrane protein OmpA-like peptidoglycan-associated protein
MLQSFSLTSTNPQETFCAAYEKNKEQVYKYDHRHKDMDYTLYAKGKLPVELTGKTEDNLTGIRVPPPTPVIPDTLKLGDVLFDFNKAALKTDAGKMLSAFFLRNGDKREIDSIYIEGHTDSVGSDIRNIELSKQRSQSVMEWLVSNNIISTDRIAVHAFGKLRPIATNKTPAGRALNRRVEILVFRKQ